MLKTKKKNIILWICIILMVSITSIPHLIAQTATINANTTYQTMEGFGAAIAWYNNWLTEHPNELELYNIVFRDVGLDILRIRNTYRYKTPFDEGNAEIVQMAEYSLGYPIIVYISSWSPPADIKSNNNTEGRGGTLLSQGGSFVYDLFADYWYDSLVAYADVGIVPKYISIQNEPDYTADWESCVFEEIEDSNYPGYGIALDAVYNRIQSLSNTPLLLGAETTGIVSNLVQNYAANMNLNQVYGIAHHLYNGGDPNNPDSFNSALQGVASSFPDKPIFQTEYDGGSAFNTAQLIHNCIVEGNAVAYIFWELVWENTNGKCMVILENPQSSDSWGTPGGYTITDYYYYVKQYSKFIDPGHQRIAASIDASSIKISAFKSANGDQLTVVMINEGSDTTVSLNINGFTIESSEIYRTGGNDKFTDIGSLGSGNSVNLPGQSVTTVLMNASGYQATAVPPPLPTPEPPPESRSAFNQIEAETYNEQSGILTEQCGEGGRAVAYIENGDYVVYYKVDFASGAVGFEARAASGTDGGNIEVRLDSSTGLLIGTIEVTSTGGWQAYSTFSTQITGIRDISDLYLVFTGTSGYLMNLNWFTFIAGNVTPTPVPTPTPSPGGSDGDIRLQYRCQEINDIAQEIKPHVNILNIGESIVPLDELTLRYFYTNEGQVEQEFHTDYVAMGNGNITGEFYDGYLQIGFMQGAGEIAPGGQTGEIQLRYNKSDWSNYDQSDDYSFDPTITEFTEYTKITLYRNGSLIFGYEPDTGTPEPTPSVLTGDVNLSGVVDIIDALIVSQYYVGLNPVAFTAPLDTGDCNQDGSVNIVDALLIAQYYVGIIDSLPIN